LRLRRWYRTSARERQQFTQSRTFIDSLAPGGGRLQLALHVRVAFEDYLQLSDEKRKLVREPIAELAKGASGRAR